MTMTTTADFKAHAAHDYDQVLAELGALKKEFSDLMNMVKSTVRHDANSAAGAMGHSLDDARKMARRGIDELESQASGSLKAIGHQVEERPIASLLIAFSLGAAASKLLLR
jgi:ElaB/YqjD/DUF883 family membrane-anchored ribosome-binding protein